MTAQSAEQLGFQGTGVSIFPITQATAATFTDLFIGVTFLCFICAGSKRVVCPVNGEFVGEAGDLLIFPLWFYRHLGKPSCQRYELSGDRHLLRSRID